MLLNSLVAYATPEGHYHIDPDFEQLANARHVEAVENNHRSNIARTVSQQGYYRVQSKPTSAPQTHPIKKRKSPR